MGFGAPLALFALAALGLPLLVHLRQRRTRRPLRVGSVRHLAGAPPPPRSGRRLTERRLLALRLAVVGLLALVIAEPFLAGSGPLPARKLALVSAPAGEARPDTPTARLIDSLRESGYELRTIAAGEDVWRALRTADAELPAGSSIALVATERVRVGGLRPSIAGSVSVHLFPGPPDSASGPPARPPPVHRAVTVVAPPGRADDARYLAAAFRAVAELRGDTLDLSFDPGRGPASRIGEWLVWLPDSTTASLPPQAIRQGAHLLADGGAGPRPTVQRDGESLTWIHAGRFSADSGDLMLSGELPELIAAIWPDPAAATVPDSSLRRVSAGQLLPVRSASARGGGSRTPAGMPLLAAAALLFLLERWVALRGVWSRA